MTIQTAIATRPLRCWRADQLAALQTVLEQAVRAWAIDWALPAVSCVHCRRAIAGEVAVHQGTTFHGEHGAVAWLGDAPWAKKLGEHIFGGPAEPGGIAEEVLLACMSDLERQITRALEAATAKVERATVVPELRNAWDGWVHASLPFEASLLLNAAAVEGMLRTAGASSKVGASLPSAPATTPLLRAASSERVSLRAQLETCEVDLGVLQDLQPGDVLRIPHRLDLPLQVRTESGTTVFSGYLAATRGRKSLELAAVSAFPSP